jgi:Ca2+-binding RTX toxin-like protein
MAVLYADGSKDFSISGIQYFSTVIDWVPVNPTLIQFNDQILSGVQQTTVHGDFRDLDMKAVALSNNTTPGVYTMAIDSYTIQMGSDNLTFADKNNVLFGDMQDLTLHAVGGITSGGVLTSALITNDTFTYGGDAISAGNGNNTVYGDARDLSLIAEKGNNQDGSIANNVIDGVSTGPASVIADNHFFFGVDTIVLGNGKNTVYGDVANISMMALGGTDTVSPGEQHTLVDEIAGNDMLFAGDTITVGNGANLIYGDFKNWQMLANGGTVFGPPNDGLTDMNGEIVDNVVTMGADTIKLGDGNNIVYGDGQSMVLQVTGSQALGGSAPLGLIQGNSFQFGSDIIKPADGATAAGHNIVYGDLQNLTLDNQSGHATTSDFNAGSQIRLNTFTMGADQITLGDGGNQIYGDLNDLTFQTQGGVNDNPTLFIRNAAVTGNTVTMGADEITSGNGVDTIYGDAHNVAWSAAGGVATVHNSPASLSVRSGIPDSIAFAQDTVHAGGGNDLIAGDAWDVSIQAIGGQASKVGLNAFGWVNNATMTGGSDSIYGDAGNDTIYGDMHSLSLSVLAGQVTGTGGNASAHMINTSITLGADCLFGGDGNDILYGDLANLNFSAVAGKDTTGVGDVRATFSGAIPTFDVGGGVADTGSTLKFGNDVLNGGAGNDILIGDALNVTGLNKFLTGLNSVIWGNDTLTGGAGVDTFAFSIQGGNAMQGNDIITDFNVGGAEKMQFSGVANMAALNTAVTSFNTVTDVGGSAALDTVITFAGGGSITLYDTTITSFTATNAVIV